MAGSLGCSALKSRQDSSARVAFMTELLKRLHLEGSPTEHLAQRAARHWEELVQFLVRSLDDFQQRLRSL